MKDINLFDTGISNVQMRALNVSDCMHLASYTVGEPLAPFIIDEDEFIRRFTNMATANVVTEQAYATPVFKLTFGVDLAGTSPVSNQVLTQIGELSDVYRGIFYLMTHMMVSQADILSMEWYMFKYFLGLVSSPS